MNDCRYSLCSVDFPYQSWHIISPIGVPLLSLVFTLVTIYDKIEQAFLSRFEWPWDMKRSVLNSSDGPVNYSDGGFARLGA